MQPAPGNGHRNNTDKAGYLPSDIPASAIYSYNLDDSKTPGGIKVRWKWRIETGRKAEALDARQAEVIRRILQWQYDRKHQLEQ